MQHLQKLDSCPLHFGWVILWCKQDKIQLLLQNQPRFPEKLILNKIQNAWQTTQNNVIKVDMSQITSSMPNILSFMGQQEQILQNAFNGILSTTWNCKYSCKF